MKIDANKIAAKLNDLNSGDASNPWIAVDGYNAVTQVSVDAEKPAFMPASGILVKAFVNKKSGELRFFPLLIFEVEENK